MVLLDFDYDFDPDSDPDLMGELLTQGLVDFLFISRKSISNSWASQRFYL